MTGTLLDLSRQPDLRGLSALTAAVRAAAAGTPFFVAGATARDALLWFAHQIRTGRATGDVDIAVAVGGWQEFSALKGRLLASGAFAEVPKLPGRVVFQGSLEVDLLPFGGIEGPDRSIAWPPDRETVLNVFAFREVLAAAIEVRLPDGEWVRMPSLAGLGLLKLVAWGERRLTAPGKDAADLGVILRHYLTAGNEDRLWSEGAHLLAEPGFDYESAGAWLLGRDMATLLDQGGRAWLTTLLRKEADPEGALRLVGDMRLDPNLTLSLLQAAARGAGEAVEEEAVNEGPQ